ncbi:MAG: four helix bundle protein [Bacteroidetes bacterium]|nr:four helix bundle protein [Bacteroidota bacterium]MDA1119696.1 four helix bundle protein [Bacteroidota bacterium]
MHNFRELQVWQKAIDLVKDVYNVSAQFPLDERYGLTSQVRRSAVSIPSNIAEGCSRKSPKDLSCFLRISQGSAFELETQLIIANRLELIDDEVLNIVSSQIVEIQKMLYGFEKKLWMETN